MDQISRLEARRRPSTIVPFVRTSAFAPFIHFLDAIGAPTDRLLRQARIPAQQLEDPEALVPRCLVFRFFELAARHERIENLGMVVGEQASAFNLGNFGKSLQGASTLYEYLQIGIRLIGSVSTGERFWLSAEGDMIRVNQFVPGNASVGLYLADTYSLAVTINALRRFVGPSWVPGVVHLLDGDDKVLGNQGFFGGARITPGQSHSSFTIPKALLQRSVPRANKAAASADNGLPAIDPPMPEGFKASIEQLIVALLGDGYSDICLVAESVGMSPRTLQRRLGDVGLTYSNLVAESRKHLAGMWLIESDMPVAEIATALGYTDASNFSRAFRRQTGLSPRSYRLGRQAL